MIKSILFCGLLSCGVLSAQQQTPVVEGVSGNVEAPESVSQSAQKAVQALGNEVLKSNFKYAVDKMYPRWKARQAKQMGGIKKLEQKLNQVGTQMQAAGISIIGFKAHRPTGFFKVWPVRKDGVTEVRSADDVEYQWMALVPTTMTIRVIDMEARTAPRRIERYGFQVAIARMSDEKWTFIDGATLKASELRGLFTSLPQNIQFPQRGGKEIK